MNGGNMGSDNQEKRPRVGVAVCVEKDGKVLLGKEKELMVQGSGHVPVAICILEKA